MLLRLKWIISKIKYFFDFLVFNFDQLKFFLLKFSYVIKFIKKTNKEVWDEEKSVVF